MSPTTTRITTKYGEAVPPAEKHSITFHLPEWSHLLRLSEKDPTLFAGLKSVYPRVIIHPDVKLLFKAILEYAKALEGSGALVFMSPTSAKECIKFATQPPPATATSNGAPVEPITLEEISYRVFEIQNIKTKLHTLIFPSTKASLLIPFWQNTGTGITTRLAAQALTHIDYLQETEDQSASSFPESDAHIEIKERISTLLQREALGAPQKPQVSREDVYLFQTGMTSIYQVHKYLLSANSYVQKTLRQLADEYDTLLIVDDTIGSFCNVDLLGTSGADILVTSLTKSFSRMANVMGGSAVLNPLRPRFNTLKKLFHEQYENGYSDLDAEVLAQNSRTYLSTSQKCQTITTDLVSFLVSKASSPSSAIKSVFYPTTSPKSLANYEPWKRPDTSEFKTGYGCLLSLEFESVAKMKVFYEAVQVHIGPHFGATKTLMFAYVKGLYNDRLEWIGEFGLKENMLRIAPGLEEDLVQVFREAVDVMDGVAETS